MAEMTSRTRAATTTTTPTAPDYSSSTVTTTSTTYLPVRVSTRVPLSRLPLRRMDGPFNVLGFDVAPFMCRFRECTGTLPGEASWRRRRVQPFDLHKVFRGSLHVLFFV